MFCARHDRQSVTHVQFTHQIQMKLEAGNLKLRRRRGQFQVESAHGVVVAEAKPFHRTVRGLEQ